MEATARQIENNENDIRKGAIDISLISQVISYDVTDAVIKRLDARYSGDAIQIKDKESYKSVVTGLSEVRGLRLKVEARRKELKADALEYGRKVDGEAKRIKDMLSPIEDRLKAAKKTEDDRKAAIKAQKEAEEKARVDSLRKKISDIMSMTTGLLGLDSEQLDILKTQCLAIKIDESEYMEFTQEAIDVRSDVLGAIESAIETRVRLDAEAEERKAEEARLMKIRAAQEAEAKRLAHEREKQEAIARAEAEKIAEENRKIEAEKARLKEEQDRIEREAVERKALENARIQAKKDEEERLAREQSKRIQQEKEAEKRRILAEALKPDKEKMIDYGNAILNLHKPELSTERAVSFMNVFLSGLEDTVESFIVAAEKL